MLSVGFPQSNMQPNYNHCPTDPTDTILLRDGQRVFEKMRWGLIPQWWNKPLKELRLVSGWMPERYQITPAANAMTS